MIDFAFAPPAGIAFVDSLTFDDQVPWKTHFGLQLTIKADAANARIRQVPTPLLFRHPQRPRKTADPASKSSKKRATLAPKLEAQREEHARRSAARHLRIQDMKLRYRRGAPVPARQAPMRMQLDLDDTDGPGQPSDESEDLPPEEDLLMDPSAEEFPLSATTYAGPCALTEATPDASNRCRQNPWEADTLWNALRCPPQPGALLLHLLFDPA